MDYFQKVAELYFAASANLFVLLLVYVNVRLKILAMMKRQTELVILGFSFHVFQKMIYLLCFFS